jgi:4-hydroxy-4-methyl-2-oxoglutarate aldolase
MMNSHLEEIAQFCIRNRVSSTEVADALNKTGVHGEFYPIDDSHYAVGRIKCVFTANKSNYEMHSQIEKVEPNDVVVIFTSNCDNFAIFGELVAKYLLLYKQASGVVVFGLIRDKAAVTRNGYRIWSQGFTPLGCNNTQVENFDPEKADSIREKFEGGIAICDAGGVTLIESNLVNSETLERIKEIEALEDLWFYCLDVLKWSTYEIVCEKKYLKETSEIPRALLKHIGTRVE